MFVFLKRLYGWLKHLIQSRPDYDPSKIGPTGAWNISTKKDVRDHHFYDRKLSHAILQFFKRNLVYRVKDMGCGDGSYIQHWNTAPYMLARGYDGNPNTLELTNGWGVRADLTDERYPFINSQWTVSLEVGEHIPAEHARAFLNNLCRGTSHGIIISWAVPGQFGYGHVNCQPNEWVEDEMRRRGFIRDKDAETTFRYAAKISWFKNTLMVYRRFVAKG
jgi:hypothetical protein